MGTLLKQSYGELASDEYQNEKELDCLRSIQILKDAATKIVEEDPNAFFNRDLRRKLLEKAQSLGLCDKLDPVTINEIAIAATLEYYNSRIYEEVLPDLNEVLKIYKNVATELGITNQLDLAQLYTYMIDEGYYSPDPQHREFRGFFRFPKPFLTHKQFDVIQGIRNPRGEATMLTEQIRFCGGECANIIIGNEEIPRGAIETINGKADLKFLLPWVIHGGVLLNCGNNKSGIVMPNGFVLASNSSEEAKLINPNSAGTFSLELPYSLLCYSNSSNDLQSFEDLLFQPREALTTNDVRESQKRVEDIITNSIDTLVNARQEASAPIGKAYAKVRTKTICSYMNCFH